MEETLKFNKCESVDFKLHNCFQHLWPEMLKKYSFGTRLLKFYFCTKVRIFGKFEGANFKYDNNFLKLLPKNTQVRKFWSQL